MHAAALKAAFSLAKATRKRELEGKRTVKTFDARGLHPLSVEWGRILALEELEPSLAMRRSDESVADLRRRAEHAACVEFERDTALALGLRYGWITEEQARAMRDET